MEGSKTYAEYLLNDKSLLGHPAMMPMSAHAPVSTSKIEGGASLAQARNPKLVEKLVAQSKARVASMNTGIRPGVLKEIENDNQLAIS